MLGHEIAHAIISSFFIVPPPEKIQEVLAGYVDYSLLKKSRAIRSPAVNIINTNNLPQPVAAHSDPGESNVTSISSTTNSAL
jgi:hypothetical protein